MPLTPIDLQVMFTQMDKVAKAQVAQQDGRTVAQAMHGAKLQQKIEEQVQEVNQAQDFGDGAEKITDRGKRGSGKNAGKNGSENGEDNDGKEKKSSVFCDPSLGKNIDISL